MRSQAGGSLPDCHILVGISHYNLINTCRAFWQLRKAAQAACSRHQLRGHTVRQPAAKEGSKACGLSRPTTPIAPAEQPAGPCHAVRDGGLLQGLDDQVDGCDCCRDWVRRRVGPKKGAMMGWRPLLLLTVLLLPGRAGLADDEGGHGEGLLASTALILPVVPARAAMRPPSFLFSSGAVTARAAHEASPVQPCRGVGAA